MAKMTPEIEEFAEIGQSVMEKGIQVFFRRDDALKLFGAVLAANVTAYYVIEKYKKRQADKRGS